MGLPFFIFSRESFSFHEHNYIKTFTDNFIFSRTHFHQFMVFSTIFFLHGHKFHIFLKRKKTDGCYHFSHFASLYTIGRLDRKIEIFGKIFKLSTLVIYSSRTAIHIDRELNTSDKCLLKLLEIFLVFS